MQRAGFNVQFNTEPEQIETSVKLIYQAKRIVGQFELSAISVFQRTC